MLHKKMKKFSNIKKGTTFSVIPLRGWRRPTFPQANAVSSARRGLTSLFGMGRGGPPCYSHHVYLSRFFISTWL